MNKKGFTLIELIAIIIIISIIMVLSYSSFTNTIKKTKLKEVTDFHESIINAATIYIEGHISDYPELSEPGSIKTITLADLIAEGYIEEDVTNPSECSIENIVVEATKQSDYTIDYEVVCNQ